MLGETNYLCEPNVARFSPDKIFNSDTCIVLYVCAGTRKPIYTKIFYRVSGNSDINKGRGSEGNRLGKLPSTNLLCNLRFLGLLVIS